MVVWGAPPLVNRDEVNVDVEGLTDTDLDYGIDVAGLASLRRRAMRTINMYLGTPHETHACILQCCPFIHN